LDSNSIESGRPNAPKSDDLFVTLAVEAAVKDSFVGAAKKAIWFAMFFLLAGTVVSFMIPENKHRAPESLSKNPVD
jgi:hypothetical protein